METRDFPRTLLEFEDRFGSEEACRDYLMNLRWPDGFRCPHCGRDRYWRVRARPLLMCASCGRQTSLTARTMFHGTRKPLRMWFRAIFLITSQRTGTSALNLQRQLGFGSYETAWVWLHKLRRAMVRPNRESLSNLVELDESYVGGKDGSIHGREIRKKALVVAAVERRGRGAGRVRLESVSNASGASLLSFVQRNVQKRSIVRTDAWRGYSGLRMSGYVHRVQVIGKDRRQASQLFPHVHRVFALLKRWLMGTYQGAVRPRHLHAYLHEFEFRFNRRKSGNVTLPFQRLCEIAVRVGPLPYPLLVGGRPQYVVPT